MNDAVRVSSNDFLTTADLAARSDFTVGLALVSPSSRTMAGPGGTALVEPRVMQVLVVLGDARGHVVTRESLFQRCWGGVYVGDDSLNRTVAAIRKLAADVGGGSFEIETIPRTGYRLKGSVIDLSTAATPEREPNRDVVVTRRAMIGAAAVAVSGGSLWLALRPKANPRFEAVMGRGDEAFRDGSAFEEGAAGASNNPAMIRLYQEAVRLNPVSARAWGLLGYFRSASTNEAAKHDLPTIVADAQTAIHRALDLDPREPNARVAMFLLQGPMLSWSARDRQLRDILRTDPSNIPAMMELMPLLQAAGLTRESWTWNECILKVSPFLRGCLVVRALKLWILGRLREADDVINRVAHLWPDYWFANYARFTIFALTGRPRAARTILDEARGLPAVETRSKVLAALETRSHGAIAPAQAACVDTARTSPPSSNDVVMYLCALGLVDTAFEVTEGYLLWRGKMISSDQASAKEIDDYNRRMTQWLFTPPVAVMRADERFAKLCDDFGLSAYWRARGVEPDYQVLG